MKKPILAMLMIIQSLTLSGAATLPPGSYHPDPCRKCTYDSNVNSLRCVCRDGAGEFVTAQNKGCLVFKFAYIEGEGREDFVCDDRAFWQAMQTGNLSFVTDVINKLSPVVLKQFGKQIFDMAKHYNHAEIINLLRAKGLNY